MRKKFLHRKDCKALEQTVEVSGGDQKKKNREKQNKGREGGCVGLSERKKTVSHVAEIAQV